MLNLDLDMNLDKNLDLDRDLERQDLKDIDLRQRDKFLERGLDLINNSKLDADLKEIY